MADPKGFMKFKRQDPVRRPVKERVGDWKEFYLPQDPVELKTQATRCMDCGIPFCQGNTGCPVENLIPDWNELVSNDRWEDALRSLHRTNNFPEFTGKLCPAPCETACVLGITDKPVSIRSIESNIIDRGFTHGWVKPISPLRSTGKRIAVVGSGPAGLAAAQQLVRAGHAVSVFDKHDRIGGLLRYGIPDFKMEKWVLDRRLEQMSAEGVVFKTGMNIGDAELVKLRAEFDAVCLATGAEIPRDIDVPGRNLDGIHFAMDYLIQANRIVAGDTVTEPLISAKGKRVIVIGGGDTGSDCIGTAHRQGAIEVFQFEHKASPPEGQCATTPWPMWPKILRASHAHEEGCNREWSVTTTGFSGKDGRVTHLDAVRTDTHEKIQFEAELIIFAMGFKKPATLGAIHYKTGTPGVFVAGDARRGASLIVWAIAEGRKMAEKVEEFLQS